MTEQMQLLGRRVVVGLVCASLVLSQLSAVLLAQAEETPPQTVESSLPAETTPEPSPEPSSEPTPEPSPESTPESSQTLSETTPESTETETIPEPESTPENQGDAEINTGDAISSAGSQNEANTNAVDTSGENATTTVENTNTADVENSAEASANTGDNTAGGGGASITTGDAVASANVINVINTNIINSPGILAFFNFLFGGGFDLRMFDLSFFFGNGTVGAQSNCSLTSCSSGDGSLTVSNTNDAEVTNTLLVRSSTGGNNASSTGSGDASIQTGDAYASANVFNLVNTNMINSNYLLLAVNNFGDMFGDITLPGASFFEMLMQGGGGSLGASTTISNTNTATVTNTASTTADTGGNTATGGEGGDATINTGNAYSSASTYNQVNSNLIGGSTVFFLINIFGDWGGQVQGLPAGMTWAKTPTGIVLMSESGAFSEMSGGAGSTNPVANSLSTLGVTNNNTANVTNNVQAWALTGANQADADGEGDADISTGDAYASSNVVNMVNTNIIGRNWIFAIFNIFGNWSGNLSFGKPDLWIGAVAETPNPTISGSDLKYHFTISNRGDADATNVVLDTSFLHPLLKFTDGGGTDTEKGKKWDLGTIFKGETKEFTFIASAGAVPPGTTASADLLATVSSTENDNNALDNTEQLSVLVQSMTSQSNSVGNWTTDPKIKMTKKASVATTTVDGTVDYEVVIHNTGGPAYNVVLTDTLKDPVGKTVYKRSWDLDTIPSGEEISLTYSIEYKGNLPLGVYTNTAKLKGQRNHPDSVYAVDIPTMTTSAKVELVPGGEVLGVETESVEPLEEQCSAFITAYLSPDGENSSVQVRRLQYFLRDFQHANVVPNGVYDEATIEAVKAFQDTYADEILMPWGMSGPSGVVYYTTQQKINELYCQGIAEFPLSPEQKNQILSYKKQGPVAPTFADDLKIKWSGALDQFFLQGNLSPAMLLETPTIAMPTPSQNKAGGLFSFDLFSLFRNLFALSPVYFTYPHAEASSK